MLFYGTKAVSVNSALSQGFTCPNCETTDSTTIHVFRRHAHIYWIPIFPAGKTGSSECSNCKHVMEPKEMPIELKEELKIVKKNSSGPIWQFSGLAIIACLISWGVYTSGQHDDEVAHWIAAPAIGDIYEYKTETGNYSTLKVKVVLQDSLVLIENAYETEKKSGISEIDVAENYDIGLVYSKAISDVQKMHSSGTIYDIERKEN